MKFAAGVIPFCVETKRFLIAKRGPGISSPNKWCNFGGKADPGETASQTASREFVEESGYSGEFKLIDQHPVRNPDGFIFVNYIAIVPKEFTPTTINKLTVDGEVEVAGAKWLTVEQLKKLIGSGFLHPGLDSYLADKLGDIQSTLTN